ncbi:hypothetical protein [Gordonia sp. (in: high G+C Gram-positive bacteria)]|uniref:hypothetical protein n=1 Tax=Gordonia sp. (in: high G+C Gram-positive bacteria) TaxID=84139 RepID=UPI0039E6DB72
MTAATTAGHRRGARVILVATALLAALAIGFLLARAVPDDHGVRRDFLFQVDGLHSPNQNGHTVNYLVHYRLDDGLAEKDLPNYLHLRRIIVDRLTRGDFAGNPFWETVNKDLCSELKATFPLAAISCQLQTPGVDVPGNRYEPGWHSSVHTIGDIEPLATTGPITATPSPSP